MSGIQSTWTYLIFLMNVYGGPLEAGRKSDWLLLELSNGLGLVNGTLLDGTSLGLKQLRYRLRLPELDCQNISLQN